MWFSFTFLFDETWTENTAMCPKSRQEKHDTDLQVNLQALVIDFCLKSDEMELLCDDERRLNKGDHKVTTGISCIVWKCVLMIQWHNLLEKFKLNILRNWALLSTIPTVTNSTYIAIGPSAITAPLFS